MPAKHFAAALLLAFVAFSLAELALKELRLRAWAAPGGDTPQAAAVTDAAAARRTIVYYFHGSRQCAECRRIEDFGRQAVQEALAGPLADGSLVWRVVNYDEPANRHFDADYKLGSAPAIVLVQLDHGRQVRWKYLTDVWSLATTADRPAFVGYVERELRAFIIEK